MHRLLWMAAMTPEKHSMLYWVAVASIPALGIEPGDVVVYNPSLTAPFTITRPIDATPLDMLSQCPSGALLPYPLSAACDAAPPAPRLRLLE